ncbi:rubredoxin-like domain-containing protein [Lacrimispora saccharolytica]
MCGFVYIGDDVPAICPVCKVPSLKITQIPKGVA